MVTQTIQKQIDTFITRLTKKMQVERVILYGSSIVPDTVSHDIDIIVIGKFPTKDPEGFLYDLYTDIPRTIDFHAYGVSSDKKHLSSFLLQAIQEGKTIFSS